MLVVNGLQTTETLYRTLTERIRPDDERAILIKIIMSSDDDVRARIIKATNYQSTVDLASLRSLDQLQRNIEAYLFDHGWFYERLTHIHLSDMVWRVATGYNLKFFARYWWYSISFTQLQIRTLPFCLMRPLIEHQKEPGARAT